MMQRRAVLGGIGALLAAPKVQAQSPANDVAAAFVGSLGIAGVTWAVRQLSGKVFTGAAGFADRDAAERMVPDHRMRIASISKTMTAAMVLALEAADMLWVGHQPFGPEGMLRDLVDPAAPSLPVLELITLDNLLTHTSGGWPNLENDPMFLNPALDHGGLIRKALTEQAPETMPGSTFAYSNFGYCLLGRIIERATALDCTTAVQSVLAFPVGANSFALAGDILAGRLDGEVVYASTLYSPYSMPIRRLDAAGGWIANAADLLAILSGFDGAGPETVASVVAGRMAEPGTPGGPYGRGLLINPNHGNRWHNGLLPGTTTFAVMLENGDLVCALANEMTDATPYAIETLVFDLYRAAVG